MVVAGILGNHLREVEPAAHTLVGEVVDAALALVETVLHDVEDGVSEVQGVSGRAALVEDHLQLVFRGRQVEHGFDEVVTILAVEPCRAEDEVVDAGGDDALLAVELRQSVDACRRALLVLLAGRVVVSATEDIVSGDMDQQSVDLLHGDGEVLGCLGVERLHDVACRLRLVDVGPCGAVDDTFDVVLLDHVAYCGKVCDVKVVIALADVGEEVGILRRLADVLHLMA